MFSPTVPTYPCFQDLPTYVCTHPCMLPLCIFTLRDVRSRDVAEAYLLNETHEDRQTCPNNVENGSDACVNQVPTETTIMRDMDSLTIANCRGTESEAGFPSFYLDVMVEPPAKNLSSTECFSRETRAAMDVFQAARMKDERGMVKGMVQGGEPNGGEQYEKGVASHGDSTFHKFYKRISRCPSQVLRCVCGTLVIHIVMFAVSHTDSALQLLLYILLQLLLYIILVKYILNFSSAFATFFNFCH